MSDADSPQDTPDQATAAVPSDDVKPEPPDGGGAGEGQAQAMAGGAGDRVEEAVSGGDDVPTADLPGGRDGEPTSPEEPHHPRIRTVDFSQPTKFSTELLASEFVRALGPFCEAFAMRLSNDLRVPVELSVVDSQQLTWSAAKASSPADAVAVALQLAPIDAQLLLSIDLPMILRALDCLLGGTAVEIPRDRRLSEVDWALTRPVLEALAAQLSVAWRDFGGLQLALGDVDDEGDAGVVIPVGSRPSR